MPSTITLHMVSSLDGFIASKNNSIDWFETSCRYDQGVDGEDPAAFLQTIDCYVMGSKTYEHALQLSENYGWAYGNTPTIVLSSRTLASDKPNIEFYNGDLRQLVNERLRPIYKKVWVAGGAMVAGEFIRQKLADEIRISILPILLGDGLPFFEHIDQQQALRLKGTIAYKNGMVELCYNFTQTCLSADRGAKEQRRKVIY